MARPSALRTSIAPEDFEMLFVLANPIPVSSTIRTFIPASEDALTLCTSPSLMVMFLRSDVSRRTSARTGDPFAVAKSSTRSAISSSIIILPRFENRYTVDKSSKLTAYSMPQTANIRYERGVGKSDSR